MIKISCIIPTINRTEFLVESINSVLTQTFPPDEIIIINNGDEMLSLPKEIRDQVKVYDIVFRAGVSQARNFGASMAKGDYLAFLDDDDLWGKDYLLNISKELNGGIDCFVGSFDQMIDDKVTKYKNASNKLTIDNLLTYNPGITGSNIVVSRKIFFEVGGFDVALPTSEDKSFIIELLKKDAKIKVLPSNQVIIRTHKNERLTDPPRMAEGIYVFTRKYSGLMTKKQFMENWKKIYKYRYKSGEKIAGFQYIILKVISLFLGKM